MGFYNYSLKLLEYAQCITLQVQGSNFPLIIVKYAI